MCCEKGHVIGQERDFVFPHKVAGASQEVKDMLAAALRERKMKDAEAWTRCLRPKKITPLTRDTRLVVACRAEVFE